MKKTILLGTISIFSVTVSAQKRPNVITILVDDMGYSDLGCFGGEIITPHIDSLAHRGVRATQFYTASRSCPSRASLMTGLYQHTAGIGWMSEDPVEKGERDPHNWGIPAYMGSLNRNCVTIAEVLKEQDYHTFMVGKWHLGIHDSKTWPLQRGFDRFYGILAGAAHYFKPSGARGLTLDNTQLETPDTVYYTTDAFTDYALDFIDSRTDDNPFFLYLAYNAPHWPLHAKEEHVEIFYNYYLQRGWDEISKERLKKMKSLGIVDDSSGLAYRYDRAWKDLTKEEQCQSARRMAVYAAQVYAVDQNVGRLISYLRHKGELENTLIFVLSDNGACAEPVKLELGGGAPATINNPTHPGLLVSYGRPWAQTSNTPFRKYKVHAYEGGISTPLIIHWPQGLIGLENTWSKVPGYLPDIMPTILEATGAPYPEKFDGYNISSLVGESLLPVVKGNQKHLHEYMYWEHQGSRAVRWKDWKAIWDQDVQQWELYNLANDRIESNDCAVSHPEILKRLTAKWHKWADEYKIEKNFRAAKNKYLTEKYSVNK